MVRSLVQQGVSACVGLIYGNEEGRGFGQNVELGSNKTVENVCGLMHSLSGSLGRHILYWAGVSA